MQRPKGPIMARLAAKEHRMNIGQRIAEQRYQDLFFFSNKENYILVLIEVDKK